MKPGPRGDFWPKVYFGQGCWEWMAATSDGYGIAWASGRKVFAHRAAWEMDNATLSHRNWG